MNEPDRQRDVAFIAAILIGIAVVLISGSIAIGVAISRQTSIMQDLTNVQVESAQERRLHNRKLLDLLERIRAERGME